MRRDDALGLCDLGVFGSMACVGECESVCVSVCVTMTDCNFAGSELPPCVRKESEKNRQDYADTTLLKW